MNNLLLKELKLGVSPFYFFLPFITGALMLVPAWLYFVVLLYFCCITIPNLMAGYKAQNDLVFSIMLPVTKRDIVKARIAVIVLLELLHIVVAILYGIISTRLFPKLSYYFYGPSIGFWGLCFVMLAVFNIILIPMYYKTAYKYGVATTAANIGAILFAGVAEWLGVKNSFIIDLFKGLYADNIVVQIIILLVGIAIFAMFNIIAYNIAIKRFEKVDI